MVQVQHRICRRTGGSARQQRLSGGAHRVSCPGSREGRSITLPPEPALRAATCRRWARALCAERTPARAGARALCGGQRGRLPLPSIQHNLRIICIAAKGAGAPCTPLTLQTRRRSFFGRAAPAARQSLRSNSCKAASEPCRRAESWALSALRHSSAPHLQTGRRSELQHPPLLLIKLQLQIQLGKAQAILLMAEPLCCAAMLGRQWCIWHLPLHC